MLNNLSLFSSDLIDVHSIDSQWWQWRSKLKGHPVLDEKKDGIPVLDKIMAAVDEYKVVIQSDKPASLRLSGGKDLLHGLVCACTDGIERVGGFYPTTQCHRKCGYAVGKPGSKPFAVHRSSSAEGLLCKA